MSVRLVIIDYVNYVSTPKGDICTGCVRHDRKLGACQHFGQLAPRPNRKSTYQRHPNCIRAEERTEHASHSLLMLKSDFLTEDSAVHDQEKQ